ncbi:MAG: hypothetical protein ABSF82_08035 [Candidatus Bathyarchaeia archaeon]
MPRKLPTSYVRKLNEQQKQATAVAARQATKRIPPVDPDSGKLKGFTMICQACGTKSKFTVNKLGYATCTNCRAIASFRFGHVA